MFDGLASLEVLRTSFEAITTDTPFVQLSSLRHPELHFDDRRFNGDKLFTGLNKLEYLSLDFTEQYASCAAINFGPLVSLTKTHLYLFVPVGYLEVLV